MDKVKEEWSYVFEGFYEPPIDHCNTYVHFTGGHFNSKNKVVLKNIFDPYSFNDFFLIRLLT